MERPLEIKDSTTTAEEPIKSEQLPQSPHSSGRSDGAASPPPNCSICLGKLINTSFTDSCLHQFCFTCLLQWSKIKTECPLCKQTFKSIIHNVRSEEDYDQYHVPPELVSQMPQPQVTATLDVNLEVDGGGNFDFGLRRVFYRTTMGAPNRRYGVLMNPEQMPRREQLPSMAPQVPRNERRRRRANPIDYRRTVYRLGIWATALPDVFGRFRECSAEYYRRQPQELDRLIPWLVRELRALLNNNASYYHISYVMRIITETLTQYDIRSPQFRDHIRPYFGVHTDHFVHELLNFARTNFDLVRYDESVTYVPQALSNEYVSRVVSPTSSSSSSTSYDSDVRLIDEAIDLRVNTDSPSVGPHHSNMPGPSTVTQVLHLEMSYRLPDVLTISSSSSDDECQVIGYLKPRHERTPEIIELVSSDPDEVTAAEPPSVNINVSEEPSTSSNSKRRFNKAMNRDTAHVIMSESVSSETESSDSDDDYDPRRSARCSKYSRSSSKKRSKMRKRRRSSNARSRNKTSRNLSSSGESDTKKRGSRRTRRNSQYGKRKRLSSSSECSAQDTDRKEVSEDRSRRAKCSTKAALRVRKDLIKKEARYDSSSSESSSSNSSSSDSDGPTKERRSRSKRKPKRRYLSSTSDESSEASEKKTKGRDKGTSKQSVKKDERRKESRSTRSRSRSESSDVSGNRVRENTTDTYECDDADQSNLRNREPSRRKHEASKSPEEAANFALEVSSLRSSSQCSERSNKSHAHRKRSRHKAKRKDKERERAGSKTSGALPSASSASSAASATPVKLDRPSAKYVDLKGSVAEYKEKRRERKARKGSKSRRRSRSESKSKSKKRRRRVRSSSSSHSE